MFRIYFLIIFCFIWAVPSHAAIISYLDKNGRTWYVNQIEAIPEQYRDQVKGGAVRASMRPKRGEASLETEHLNASLKIEIFVTDWCPHCRSLEDFLNSKGLKYTRYDIEKNSIGIKKYRSLGLKSVPVIKIGSRVQSGFNRTKLIELLQEQ